MKSVMPIAIALGYGGGVVLSYYCGRWIVSAFTGSLGGQYVRRNLARLIGIVCGLAAMPAIYLGTVVGGNFGGAYGEVIGVSVGFGMAGVPVGLALGIAFVMTLVTSGGVFVGVVIGRLLNTATDKT